MIHQTNGFIVGISGGIDSAITSTLCALSGKIHMVLTQSIKMNRNLTALTNMQMLTSKFQCIYLQSRFTETFDTLSKQIPEEIKSHLTIQIR